MDPTLATARGDGGGAGGAAAAAAGRAARRAPAAEVSGRPGPPPGLLGASICKGSPEGAKLFALRGSAPPLRHSFLHPWGRRESAKLFALRGARSAKLGALASLTFQEG